MISAVALELRDNLDTEALQELQEFLAEAMDRHADKSARDDRESSNSTPRTKAEVFCDDFASFQGAGAGIYLVDNEQARAVESSKSAQKTTPKKAKQ